MKKFLVSFFGLILISLGVLSYLTKSFFSYHSPTLVTVSFEKGSSLRRMSQVLADHQVVPNAFSFEVFTRLVGKGSQLKAGEYEFSAGLRPSDVLEKMVAGLVKVYSFTIPEGYNLNDIGKILVEKRLTTPEEWKNFIQGKNLEGFLYPDTYFYSKTHTLADIVAMMTDLFKKKTSPLMEEVARQHLTVNQWVTLASIVEKETGLSAERPLIAAVFLNRLKINMPLQTDPTVIYGISNFNGNLTRADLERDTPYNTYTRLGLPPGPICSPGMAALMAVLHPASSEALYFVAKGDGSHYFSSTLEQHNRAVDFYQRHQGSPP